MSTGSQWPKVIRAGHATVTVYRNRHPSTASGWIYVLAWHTANGRRREKFADKAAALAEARSKAKSLSLGRVGWGALTVGDREELEAARQLAGGIPVIAALEEWAKARGLAGGNLIPAAEAWAARNGGRHIQVTVDQVVREFMKAKTAAGKNVADDHKSTFERILEDLGRYVIDTVSAKQLDAWLANWENPVTRNTRRKRLVAIWRWAQRKNYLPRDARTEAEMTDAAHEPAPVIGIIRTDTWRILLHHFHRTHLELLPSLVLAGFAGLRRDEVHHQVWEDISLERKNLRVTNAKRGTPARRMVPLSEAAVSWLALVADRRGSVCSSLAIDGVRRIVSDAKLAVLPKNCFRHSYISHRVVATGDIARTALDAGTSVGKINRHYRELVGEDEARAWFEARLT